MKWTNEQQQVIDHRGQNLLVSAAAGSGKTAVLVQRILQMISDEARPVDVDRLLIVTFTKAAAAEMRGRLYQAISKKLGETPGNRQLERQLKLLPNAQICTIDSFCTYILRNHFQEIGLDPAFRVADDTEIKLLQGDCMAELLEEEYGNASPAFLQLAESLASGKTDADLQDLILKIYQFSESDPDPEQWLLQQTGRLRFPDTEALENTDWYRWYVGHFSSMLKGYAKAYDALCTKLSDPAEPALAPAYSAFREEQENIRRAAEFTTAEEARRKLAAPILISRMPSVSSKKLNDPDCYKPIKDRRDAIKKKILPIIAELERSSDDVLLHLQNSAVLVGELVRLTLRFREVFTAAKRENNLVDFGDLEHLSIQVLGSFEAPTETARMLRNRFEEIMIDEYQDSNYVQEALLSAVSRGNNMFMVGDMKQSIYRFRKARPELFIGKYSCYSYENDPEAQGRKIDLDRNFRSTKAVLDSVNDLFSSIMQEQVGGIDYDEAASLKVSEPESPLQDKTGVRTELHLVETDADTETDEDLKAIEWEARMTGREIQKLLASGMQIYDKEIGKTRPLCFRDIVILFRATKGRDVVFREQLESMGIPTYIESKSGYFSSTEIALVLDLLAVIDNPLNDIPLGSVLHSFLFGFTDDELARIAAGSDRKNRVNGFYGLLKAYAGKPDADPALADKIADFLGKLQDWRGQAGRLTLPLFLRELYRETGLFSAFTAMPGGKRRNANLRSLITRAESFEQTSYHGIFHFIRYVDKLKASQMDEGEAGTAGEQDDVVRIMTVHKSKGLEFPVVFLCGTAVQMKKRADSAVLMHPEFGIAVPDVQLESRIRTKTLLMNVVGKKEQLDEMGEELRILYVAMTRAKEKLYLMGSVKSEEDAEEKYGGHWGEPAAPLSYAELTESASFLELMLRAYRRSAPLSLIFHQKAEFLLEQTAEEVEKKTARAELLRKFGEQTEESRRIGQMIRDRLSYPYIRDDLHRTPVSVSVSYLKHRAAEEKNQEIRMQPEQVRMFDSVPPEEKVSAGAALGTLYHLVLEHLRTTEPVPAELDRMVNEGLISIEEKDRINPNKLEKFLASPLGKRVAEADRKGLSGREQQFMMTLRARDIFRELNLPESCEDSVMIQGIIDLFIEEEDGLVVIDYKTDRITSGTQLNDRYDEQLRLYRIALERLTGKKVKETCYYSLCLDQEVKGPCE